MMPWLEALFYSGGISILALAVLWTGTATICTRSLHPGQRFWQLLPNALSGSFLLIAVGLSLRQEGLPGIALFLAASLVAHIFDLRARLSAQTPGLSRRTE